MNRMTTRKYQAMRAAVARDVAANNTRPAADASDSLPALTPQDIIAILLFLAVLRVLFPVSRILTAMALDLSALSDHALTLLQSAANLTIIVLSAAAAVLTRCLIARRRKR